ncbi:hypothetical protein Hanom_Chr11g00991591 [Helianthus anomalus]
MHSNRKLPSPRKTEKQIAVLSLIREHHSQKNVHFQESIFTSFIKLSISPASTCSKRVLPTVSHVQETILVFVFFIDGRHHRSYIIIINNNKT